MQEKERSMVLGKIKGFWIICLVMLILTGCSKEAPGESNVEIMLADEKTGCTDVEDTGDTERIAALLGEAFKEAAEKNSLGSLDAMRCMVARLGEEGYVAVDSGNQVDMAGAAQVLEFCGAVDKKEKAEVTIIVVTQLGFRRFDLKTEDGKVDVVRKYYQYDLAGQMQNRSTVSYRADFWQYTEEGYLAFEGSSFSDINYVLTWNDTPEHTMLRVLPLDEKCREFNRKYILPVGYEQNNMFLTDWKKEDYGNLDFYDIFDIFYPMLYLQSVPYIADENSEIGAVYQIPEEEFENVIMAYVNIDRRELQRKTTYSAEGAAYEYRPRGFYEVEYPDIPYPEVVSYTENPDGTITLIVNAVYPNDNTSMAYSHKTVIRPLEGNCFQYVSNQMITLVEEYDIWWHSERLTKKEWLKLYEGIE